LLIPKERINVVIIKSFMSVIVLQFDILVYYKFLLAQQCKLVRTILFK
jgi:hypothetical protein